MSKHICWRGFKRMCDRCSHSLFHAPDLNNSPRADNPCTQDHLHGTAEPGNFRLRPSVRFCSITAPSAQGAPFRHVSTQPKEESPLFLHGTIFSPRPPPPTCFIASRALSLACAPCIAREHISDTAGRPSRGAQLQLPSTGTPPAPQHPASVSRNHTVLSWSSSCVEALTVEASSVLTAAASGSKLWHLLTTSPPCSSRLPQRGHPRPP